MYIYKHDEKYNIWNTFDISLVKLYFPIGETLAAMSDDHRSSSGNLSGEEQSGNVDDERVSSSLQTKQNSNPTDIATSGASYTQNMIR